MALYLALGDSLTAGYGVGQYESFASIYHRMLSAYDPNLGYINDGINGLTIKGLAARLSFNPRLKFLAAQAKIITITIGSNDLLDFGRKMLEGSQDFKTQLEAFLSRFSVDLDSLGRQLRLINPQGIIKVAAIYNPLPAGPLAHASQAGQYVIDLANRVLKRWAKAYGLVLVRIDRAFRGQENSLIGPDGIHPIQAGHQVMAMSFFNS